MINKVSIVIPVYVNNKDVLKMTIGCLKDVLRTYGVETEIIVVDDGSKEPISCIIPKLFPDVKLLINEHNLGFAKSINKGIRASTSQYICLLNNDIKLPNPGWLKAMVASLDEFDLTAPAGGRMDGNWNYQPGEAKKRGERFSYLVGWCILIKRDVFDTVGLIPEDFGKGFWEDVLFGYRAKKYGFKAGITEGTGVIHLYHQTFLAEGFNLAEEYQAKRKIFLDVIRKEK